MPPDGDEFSGQCAIDGQAALHLLIYLASAMKLEASSSTGIAKRSCSNECQRESDGGGDDLYRAKDDDDDDGGRREVVQAAEMGVTHRRHGVPGPWSLVTFVSLTSENRPEPTGRP